MRDEELSRRMFVRAAGLAAASLAIKPASVLAVKRTGVKRDICVFSKHLQWLDYDAMAETAAEIGFDGVDLSVRPGGHVLPERVTDNLPRAVEAVKKAGLHVPMMTTKIQDANDRYTEPVLKTASNLDIGYYRMGYLSYDDQLGVAGSLKRLKSTMADLAGINKKYHIHGAYQNHAGTRVGGPVWDLWELLKDLDANWMGCQYDVRHATVEGGSSWPLGMKLLAPFIRTTVIKDFHWEKKDGKWKIANVPLGEGMVDFKQYFKLVKSLNIGGPISMHFEYPMYDKANKNLSQKERRRQTIEVMKKDLMKLRSMLKGAGLD